MTRRDQAPGIEFDSWMLPRGGLVLRILTAAAACALSFALLPSIPWATVCSAVGIAGAIFPRLPFVWFVIMILAASAIADPPQGPSWHFAILMAGTHLLHVLASYGIVIPVRASIQPYAFRPALIRFVVIQIVAQVISVAVLLLTSASRTPSTGATLIVGGVTVVAALIVFCLAIVRPLIRERIRRTEGRASE